MRRLDFDQSDHEIQNSDQKSNSLLLKKNIFKKKTNIIKFITPPSCNFSKKSLKLKSFTPIPEKNNQLFELGLNKTRSFSNVIDFEKNGKKNS